MQQWWWTDRLPNADLAFLPQGTKEFATYLKELAWAQRFALENRAEMMDRFRCALAEWMDVDPRPRRRVGGGTGQLSSQLHDPRSGTVVGTYGSPVRVPSTRTKASSGDPRLDGHPLLHRARQGQRRGTLLEPRTVRAADSPVPRRASASRPTISPKRMTRHRVPARGGVDDEIPDAYKDIDQSHGGRRRSRRGGAHNCVRSST